MDVDDLVDGFRRDLEAALGMERAVLDRLGELVARAADPHVRSALSLHRDETRHHAANLERVFVCFDWDVEETPGRIGRKAGPLEIADLEIRAYERLTATARELARDDAVALLQANLDSELRARAALAEALECGLDETRQGRDLVAALEHRGDARRT